MSLKLLLDTNVWLDYFIDRGIRHDSARDLVVSSVGREVVLLAAISSVKDCFFLIAQELKRIERMEHGEVSESAENAIREVAWSCVARMRKFAYVVPADESDMLEAMLMRSSHWDFEDNLVMAAAERAQADYLVTSDKFLLAHDPQRCLSIDSALRLVDESA